MDRETSKLILLGIIWIGLIISKMIRGVKNKDSFGPKVKEMVEYFFRKADMQKEKYKGSWLCVEKWKEKIRQQTNEIANLYQARGMTQDVADSFSLLCQNLENGIQVIRDGENPLTMEKGNPKKSQLKIFFQYGIYVFIFMALMWLYIVLSSLGFGIIFAVALCSILCLRKGFPHYMISQYPEYFQSFGEFDRISIDLKQTAWIIILCACGWFLNKWTYAQAGEVQIAVTLVVPVIYGLIYYKMNHKKVVREI